MELFEGESLRGKLSDGPLPVRRALDIAVQIAGGLAAAHENGIVHRDLKPENVFVTKNSRLADVPSGGGIQRPARRACRRAEAELEPLRETIEIPHGASAPTLQCYILQPCERSMTDRPTRSQTEQTSC